jgi:hypothetical protein
LKILVVCSGLDFVNYTRRATIEAIHRLNPDLEILMFNSVLNIRKKIRTVPQIRFHSYYFWIPETLRKLRFTISFEYLIRGYKWGKIFNGFDVIFLIDPNQYYLLPYFSAKHKIIYLVRDPGVLQDRRNYYKELPVINRADAILGISRNLCSYYFEKYYGFIPANVHLWSNSVDMELWDYDLWKNCIYEKAKHIIGLAGNINYVIDIDLIFYLASNLPEYDFELAGKTDLDEDEKMKMNRLLEIPNVRHLGFIPYNEFPAAVINWSVGLVAARPDHEYALYLNNNKQYQYLSLGKPFVTYSLNSDYSEFEDMVFVASNRTDFLEKTRSAIKKSVESGIIEKGKRIASGQSAVKRAEQFLGIAKSLIG